MRQEKKNLDFKAVKVCYIIFSQTSQSLGGHYRSLKSHYISFNNYQVIDKESFIVNFGKVKSPIFEDVKNVFFIKTYFIFYIIKIIRLIKTKKPEVIHCYDLASLYLAKIISFFYDIKILYTKCGGKNSKKYIEIPTIFFSDENQKDYLEKGNKSTSFLIPNRALRTNKFYDKNYIENKIDLNKEAINFIRINRISPTYEKIMDQSVELIRRLQNDSINAKLFIVGRIEKQEVFVKYKNIDKNVFVITDPDLTHTASNLIPFFDLVIATGRGAMEAYSYGKTILCSIQHSSIPILVDKDNFETMFSYNFSPRTVIANIDEIHEMKKIKMAITERNSLSDFSVSMFEKYFNIETVTNQYKQIYNDIKTDNINIGANNFKISDYYYFISKIIKTW